MPSEPLDDKSVRVVFDCNVLLQALANRAGPAGACFQAVRDGRVLLVMSRDLLTEWADVVSRPQIVRKLGLVEKTTVEFTAELSALAMLIDVESVYQHPIDPKDTMVVNLAIAAGARVITSRDRHLLSLRDTSTPAGADFMARFGHIEILTPVELLTRLPIR